MGDEYLGNADEILGWQGVTRGAVERLIRKVMECEDAKNNAGGDFNDFILLSEHQCEKYESNKDFVYSRKRLEELKMAINSGAFKDSEGNKISLDSVQMMFGELLSREHIEKDLKGIMEEKGNLNFKGRRPE
jgi:hypothetical protein